jgi:hypothetical protein
MNIFLAFVTSFMTNEMFKRFIKWVQMNTQGITSSMDVIRVTVIKILVPVN